MLGSAINNILVEEEGIDKAEFIGKLNDAAKLINQIIFGQTKSRKAFILPGVEKQRKVLLEKAETDEFLFGKGLLDRIKEAIAMEKVGQDMKYPSGAKKTTPLQPKSN